MENEKVVCHACGQVLKRAAVFMNEGEVENNTPSFYLIPEHPAIHGKPFSKVVDEETSKTIKTICGGSFRPPKIAVH